MEYYNRKFYTNLSTASKVSAPLIVENLFHSYKPNSVVDVGAGTGDFLRVFMNFGVPRILGLEGSWAKNIPKAVPEHLYRYLNLQNPAHLNERFDLVLCLEVLEHIEPEFEANFLDFLSKLGDILVISVAIPGQGGTHHVNEQWPSDWLPKLMIRGFTNIESLREVFWSMDQIDICYRQNTFVLSRASKSSKNPGEMNAFPKILDLVHPDLWKTKQKYSRQKFWVFFFNALPTFIKKFLTLLSKF